MPGLATVVGSFPPVAGLVAVALLLASVAVANQIAGSDRWLSRVVLGSAVAHLACVGPQIWVVDHVYGGSADWVGYVNRAAHLADSWRAGHFTTAGAALGGGVLGDGMVAILGAAVMMVLGVNELAVFLVFAWLAFLGVVCFYRAFTVTFPGANHRRYAVLVFFLPSLLFWTADLGKEAIITISVGVAALGVARVFARLRHGYLLILLGIVIGIGVRPDELAILAVAFAVAMLLREGDPEQKASGLRRTGGLVVAAALTVGAGLLTARLLHGTDGGRGVSSLGGLGQLNQGTGFGFGSSGVSYSSNPLAYPVDVYHVLFDPFPLVAHHGTQLLASLENAVILVVLLVSLPNLRLVWRAARYRPYVIVCLVYSVLFVYTFAALGNLGLITRERTLMLPFLLVLTAIPIAGPERAPHPWELRRRVRRATGWDAPEGTPTGPGLPAPGAVDHSRPAGEPVAATLSSAGVSSAGEPAAASWQAADDPAGVASAEGWRPVDW